MKDKILKLIYAELENVNGDKKFFDIPYQGQFFLGKEEPIRTNSTYIFIDGDDYSNSIQKEYLDMCFSLKFSDGEPKIYVGNRMRKEIINSEFKRKYWSWSEFRKVSIYDTTYSFDITHYVTCGSVTFDLTPEETLEMMEKVTISNNKNESLKQSRLEELLTIKLDARLSKYNKDGE